MKEKVEKQGKKIPFACSGKIANFLPKVRSQNQFWTKKMSKFEIWNHFPLKILPPLHN
jgi:hypothetical protein